MRNFHPFRLLREALTVMFWNPLGMAALGAALIGVAYVAKDSHEKSLQAQLIASWGMEAELRDSPAPLAKDDAAQEKELIARVGTALKEAFPER
ncbi:MAG: hypothetical protein HY928_01050 [Elusimicrobia bacterium]|nr:hypothetical protein [Elusimicrobiota bacterium]